LTKLDLSKNINLEYLSISDNNFPEQDLGFLSHLTKLLHLAIQNYYREKDTFFYNGFKGSLKPLKNTKIKELFIANTNISEGLEYLPYLERFLVGTGQDLSINNSFYNFTNEKQRPRLQGYTKIFNNLQKRAVELEREKEVENEQLGQLSNLLFPQQNCNFNQLKQEIARLKHQELAPKLRNKKTEFEQLITTTKKKAGESLERTADLLLKTQKQIFQAKETPQKDKLKIKVEAYCDVLEGNLTQEELKNLLTKQTELCQFEQHLKNLQQNQEQLTQQIEISPK